MRLQKSVIKKFINIDKYCIIVTVLTETLPPPSSPQHHSYAPGSVGGNPAAKQCACGGTISKFPTKHALGNMCSPLTRLLPQICAYIFPQGKWRQSMCMYLYASPKKLGRGVIRPLFVSIFLTWKPVGANPLFWILILSADFDVSWSPCLST